MHLGLDPMDGEGHEAHAALRIEALHGLHESDVALLDEVGMRQAVAEIAARERHHEPQVRKHELPRSLEIALLAKAPRQHLLLLGSEDREPVDSVDISLEAARRHRHTDRDRQRHRRLKIHSRSSLERGF